MHEIIEVYREAEDNLISLTKPVEIRNKFFIDTYNFYLVCNEIATEQEQYIKAACAWAGKESPKLTVNSAVVSEIAVSLLNWCERFLADKYAEFYRLRGDDVLTSHEIGMLAINLAYDKRKTSRETDTQQPTDMHQSVDPPGELFRIENKFEGTLFAATPPDTGYLRRRLSQSLATKDEGSRAAQDIRQRLKLLDEGKIPNSFKTYDMKMYQDFLRNLTDETVGLDSKFGYTRLNVDDYGGARISEKAVDTHLIMNVMDNLNDPKLGVLCLFTNDSDFYPLVERAKAHGKQVFIFNGAKRRAKKLEELVKPENFVSLKETVNSISLCWGDQLPSGFEEFEQHYGYQLFMEEAWERDREAWEREYTEAMDLAYEDFRNLAPSAPSDDFKSE
jgi:uncharacterized LabA/DUF88 family protein